MRRGVAMLIGAVVLLLMLSSASAQHGGDVQSPDTRTPWKDIAPGERDVLLQMLESPDWPFRVFGLIRLQRYRGDEVKQMLGGALVDDCWQVRCFALQQAQRMGIAITPSDLASETDGRVIRAALRHGVAIPPPTVAPTASRLMRSDLFDDIMLGVELAAATDDDALRRDAAAVVHRLITNMNDALSAYLGRRLSRVVGLAEPMRTAQQWRDWLNQQRGKIVFTPPTKPNDPLSGTSLAQTESIIAEMNSSEFARLADYLSVLRQRDLDVVIAMDSTTSMLPMVSEARAGVDSLITFMGDLSNSMRFGFVAYRDHDNPPVCDAHPLTSDSGAIRAFLFNVRITGGADLPEAVVDGLQKCIEMKYNDDAEWQVILVGDAPPHVRDSQRLLRVLEHCREVRLTLHTVHVPMEHPPRYMQSLPPDRAQQVRRQLQQYNEHTATAFSEIATRAGGRFTSLQRAEQLVPAVMHFSIERHWWRVFDDFYEQYLELCR